ncbi:MAG: DUF456 domain-containing protein [Candidatus Krumholzibacteriota bacterium]|nr:DUF456 domain-containing protein [Candidatus Krumholzibacteriota bacterium]
MVSVLQHTGLVLLYFLVFLLNLLIFTGLPGGWISLGVILIYDLANKFTVIGWQWWVVMVVLVVIGEVIEVLLGSAVAIKKGASKWGAVGALAGGIVGAVLGTSAMPVIGSVIFGLFGAFAGAVAAEYIQYKKMENAINVGFWAFVGKLWAFFAKFAIATGILVIFIVRSWT